MKRGELDDLVLFATVARERSFTRAAARLALSPSALSHAMRSLEERLGTRLLQRTTRSVAPTEAGQHLLARLGPALAEIDTGLAELAAARERPSGRVRITTFGYIAQTVLQPRLPRFLLDHPDIEVEVQVTGELVDIVAAGFDAGLRFGDSVALDMIAVRVGPDLRAVVVGAPAYFERRPAPGHPSDLARHACIGHRLATSGGLLPWEFARDGRELQVRTEGPLIADDDGGLALSAVRAGVGLGYFLETMVAEDIAAGRLVEVLADWCPPFAGCHLYHPSRRQTPPALRALIDALSWRASGTADRLAVAG